MKKSIVIILDPAHGADVAGKCSPDKVHFEYLWSRKRVRNLKDMLLNLGYEVYLTTNSINEPGLTKRKNFATQIRRGTKKVLLSFHNNAAGNGSEWMNARGAEVFTTPGVTKADICADLILGQLKKNFPNLKLRYNRDAYLDRDKESKFTVLMGADYFGVLIEWLFQDNKDDIELLQSDEVNRNFEDSIVAAIEEINNYFK